MATARTLAKLDSLLDTNLASSPLDLKFVFKNWEDAPRKLKTAAVGAIKTMESIAPSLQTEFIQCDERAVKAIGELLCPAAQELVLSHSDYAADIPHMLKKAVMFKHIVEGVWKKLAAQVKNGELTKATVKKLLARKDCPPQFVKIVNAASGTETRSTRKTDDEPRRRPRREDEPAPRKQRRNDDDEPAPRKQRPVKETPRSRNANDFASIDFGDDDDDADVPARKANRPKLAPAKPIKTPLVKRPRVDDDFTDTRKLGKTVRTVRRPSLH